MTYTLGQAAKATGKSKPTISRSIKKGIISATKNRLGQYSIDPAELHAVYPPLPSASNGTGTTQQQETPNNDSALQRENELLREMLDKTEADRDSWKEQAQRITTLIEDKREKVGWLDKFLGRG